MCQLMPAWLGKTIWSGSLTPERLLAKIPPAGRDQRFLSNSPSHSTSKFYDSFFSRPHVKMWQRAVPCHTVEDRPLSHPKGWFAIACDSFWCLQSFVIILNYCDCLWLFVSFLDICDHLCLSVDCVIFPLSTKRETFTLNSILRFLRNDFSFLG